MTPGQREASAALGRATDALNEAKAAAPEVTAVASQLRRLREQNHFAEAIYALFQGGH